MKLTEIIKKGSEIQKGVCQFFIAEKDFYYEDLPILKDSLVYYDGKDEIKVNMVNFGIFSEKWVPELISESLPKIGLHQVVEKITTCNFEIDKLELGWHGIWHHNHFDKWSGTFSDYIDRINKIPVLEYAGISFSSLMYKFNITTGSLFYFINVKPVKLKCGESLVKLPAFIEISQNQSSFDLMPIKGKIEYFNITLEGPLFLSETGIIKGKTAEEFNAKINGHSEISQLVISKGIEIEISNHGEIKRGIFNEKTHKVEKYTIKKIH